MCSSKDTVAAAAAKSLQSCLTLRPHRQQPTRLRGPWDSPGKNAEVVCHFSRSVVSDSSRPHGLQPTRLLRPQDFPGKSTGVGCHCLLHDKPRQHIKKWRYHFDDKGLYSQSYGFSSKHVRM